MPDKVSEAYKALKGNQLFLDEADFREQVTKSPKDVFNVLSKDKSAGQLFLDYDDFETSLGLKKKDVPYPSRVPDTSAKLPSSATLSPLEIPRPQGQSEKVRVEAGATKPLPDPNKLGSFLPQDKTVTPKTDLAGAVTPAKQTAALVEERPLIKQRQEQAKQSAFENTLKAYKTKFKASETQVESERKKLEKMLNDGDLQIAKDPNTGQRILAYKNENFFSSLWDSAKRVEKNRQDNKIFSDLSLDDKIKYAEEEINKGEEYLPELPSGAMGSLGEYIAGATTPLVRPIMYGMATAAGAAMLNAPAAASAGAQTVGSSIAFIEDMMYGNRAETFKRVYAGKLKDIPNPTEQQKKQAALEADQAALAAAAVGALEAIAFSIPFGKLAKMEQSAGGYLDLVEKTAKHTMTEAPKAATIMGAGAAARGIISKEAGADLTYSDIVKESLESAKSGAELVGALGVGKVAMAALPHAMTVVAGLVRTPSKAVDSKAKAIVSELPREEVLTVYRQGEESGVYPKGTTEKVAETLKQYDEAKASVPETIEKTDTVDALTGKLEAKFKKQRELEETKVEARKKEIQAEIEALDKDIDAIYEGKPVEQHEYDITGKKISELKPVIAEEKVTEETPLTEEQRLGIESKGKAEAPTKENVTERLNINNPFYKKVSKALSDLGLIKEYNPETGEGDVVGGFVQSDGRGGFVSGDMYFESDGTIKFRKDGVVVEFDRDGNVLSENTQSAKSEKAKIEIEAKKASIQFLKDTRDSDAFKYKEVTEYDKLGNRKKVKRLKTDAELKESTNKINEQISKAEQELFELLKGQVESESLQKVAENDTVRKESISEVSENVGESVGEKVEPTKVETVEPTQQEIIDKELPNDADIPIKPKETIPNVDEAIKKSIVNRTKKSLGVNDDIAAKIHDIALNAKDYEDFKKQVSELGIDDTVAKNIHAEQYREKREEAKSAYQEQLENNLEDLREAYSDVTRSESALKKITEKSPSSLRDFLNRILHGATPEDVAKSKARLVDIQKKYRKEKAEMKSLLPRERGVNFVIEKISRAARNGDISQLNADLAIDLIRKNPSIFEDVAISITQKKAGTEGDVQGWYRAADALVKIFKGGKDETTAVHELLHHTERFLPNEVRDKIIKEWHNEVNKQIEHYRKLLKKTTNVDERQQITQGLLYLGLALERQVEPSRSNAEAMEAIMSKYLGDHYDSKGNFHKGLGNSWYQLYSPSEWWAVNASRILKDAKTKPELKSFYDKVKAFYDGLIESIKKIFNNPYAAVEEGLKKVIKGETLEDRDGTMLSASKKLLNIKQKGSFEDRLKSIYDEVKNKQVKAVEDLLGKPQEKVEPPVQVKEEVVAEAPVSETKQAEAIAERAKISPKNFKDLYKANRELFGLNRVQSFANAVVMDRMIGVMAKRAGVSKEAVYAKLSFEKVNEDLINDINKSGSVLFQKGKKIRYYHSNTTGLSGQFRLRNKSGFFGVYFSPSKKYSRTFGDQTYLVELSPKNTLVINNISEFRNYGNIFNISKETHDKLISEGYDSVAWYRDGKLMEFVALDVDIIGEREIVLQRDKNIYRGAVSLEKDGNAIIYALSSPNASTPVHELAHVFEHYITDAERSVINNWAGTKEWTTETSEKFARGFEKYLAEGKAPSTALEKVFAKFKEWLTDIYNGIKGSEIDLELNEQMRDIYAKMLGEESVSKKEPTKSIKDKFKDIADINLSDNPEVVKKREVTKYLKDNPEIADVVKNFEKVTEYLKSEKELKVVCE